MSSFSPLGIVSVSMSVTNPHLYSCLTRSSSSSVELISLSLRVFRCSGVQVLDTYPFGVNDVPQPQLREAFGLLKTHPPSNKFFTLKSSVVPARKRALLGSTSTRTPSVS